QVSTAVNRDAGADVYFFDVVGELERRGLIDPVIFYLLKQERPRKEAEITSLEEFWLDPDEKPSPKPSGGTSREALNDATQFQLSRDYEKALRALDRAAKLARAEEDSRTEAQAFALSGSILRDLGRVGEATSRYKQALMAARTLADAHLRMDILREIAGIYGTAGQTREAISVYRELLDLARQIGSRADEAATLASLARRSAQTGDEMAG